MIEKIFVSRRDANDCLTTMMMFAATPDSALSMQIHSGGVLCVERTPFGPGADKRAVERTYFSPSDYARVEPVYTGGGPR